MPNDTDLIIGSLTEFKESVNQRLTNIEHEIKLLNQFKWKVIGGASTLSVILAAGLELMKNIHHLPWKD